jgi:hypothetical protein
MTFIAKKSRPGALILHKKIKWVKVNKNIIGTGEVMNINQILVNIRNTKNIN